MTIPPFRKFPQPKREMTLEDHYESQTSMKGDESGVLGESVLQSLLVTVYPQQRQQNN